MVTFDAGAACSSHGIPRLRECGRIDFLAARMTFRLAVVTSCLAAKAIFGCL